MEQQQHETEAATQEALREAKDFIGKLVIKYGPDVARAVLTQAQTVLDDTVVTPAESVTPSSAQSPEATEPQQETAKELSPEVQHLQTLLSRVDLPMRVTLVLEKDDVLPNQDPQTFMRGSQNEGFNEFYQGDKNSRLYLDVAREEVLQNYFFYKADQDSIRVLALNLMDADTAVIALTYSNQRTDKFGRGNRFVVAFAISHNDLQGVIKTIIAEPEDAIRVIQDRFNPQSHQFAQPILDKGITVGMAIAQPTKVLRPKGNFNEQDIIKII